MKIYTIHGAGDGSWPARFIREGYSWTAAITGPVWALAHGLKLDAALLVGAWVVAAVIGALAGSLTAWVLVIAVHVGFGHLAHDRRRLALKAKGAMTLGVISALSEEHAAHRWLEQHPEQARSLI